MTIGTTSGKPSTSSDASVAGKTKTMPKSTHESTAESTSELASKSVPKSTPASSFEADSGARTDVPPLKPRRAMLLAFSIVFAVWVGILIVMYVRTVLPTHHHIPPSRSAEAAPVPPG